MCKFSSKSGGVPFQISNFLGDLTRNDPNTRVSVAYYSFYDNIQLYEPLGKALLFTSIS